MNTEQKLPKRMGRPPKPGGAISNKERQQAWRDRQKAKQQTMLERFPGIDKTAAVQAALDRE